MTRWERRELGIASRVSQIKLQTELKQYEVKDESGFTRAQMGSNRAKQLKRQIENLRLIETKKGFEFSKLVERLNKFGASDYTFKKATIFRNNYLKEMEKYSNLDNYDKLMNKLNSITNPVSFFEYLSSDELAQDLTYQSDQYYTQQAFNSFLERLGIITEDTIS